MGSIGNVPSGAEFIGALETLENSMRLKKLAEASVTARSDQNHKHQEQTTSNSPPRSPISRYILKQASMFEDLSAIMEVIWAANYSPYDPFAQLFFPVLGFSLSHRQTALSDAKARFWKQHLEDPSSNWLYVVDCETGQAVGCAQWQIFTSNPFPSGVPNLTAPWWPEGEYREFCECILNQVYRPRASWMRRPHAALNWLAVRPTYRRQGIATLLIQEGLSLASAFNLECWLEASSMGKPLYENFGFRSLFKVAFDTAKKDASDVWRKCAHEMTPQPVFAMWRPKGGHWAVGKEGVKMPWELGVEGDIT